MNRRKTLYEGKAKIVYEGMEPGTLIQYFKDDIGSDKGANSQALSGKGVLNNRISAHIMSKIEGIGVPTHFIRSLNMREQLVRQVEIIPLKVMIRNLAQGEICQRLGIEEGKHFSQPLVEFYYKDEKLGNPMVSDQHIFSFDWADPYELEEMVLFALRVNDFLTGLFSAIGLRLIDFNVEFGRLWGENDELYIILADEISLDNCHLCDAETGQGVKTEMENLVESYQEIAKRLGLIPQTGIIQDGNIDEDIAGNLNEIKNELAQRRKLRSVKKPSKAR